MILTGKTEELGEKQSECTLSPQIQHGLTDLGTNLGLSGEKLVTNHLVYGTTYMNLIKHLNQKFWTSEPVFLAYFPKMKVGLSNDQSVCVSPTNNF
jgi:hypothetical protein